LNYQVFAQQYITEAENVYKRIIELKNEIKYSLKASKIKSLRNRILALEQVYSDCRVTANHILKTYAEDCL